jgi:hypothetical protein
MSTGKLQRQSTTSKGLTAEERTGWLFEPADLKEQEDRGKRPAAGPHVRRVAFGVPDSSVPETHYVLGGEKAPICGAAVKTPAPYGGLGKVCRHCHAIASQKLAVVR